MKKLAVVIAAGAMLFTVGVAPASAVSGSACNKGTFTAAHLKSVSSQGLYMIGGVCHG